MSGRVGGGASYYFLPNVSIQTLPVCRSFPRPSVVDTLHHGRTPVNWCRRFKSHCKQMDLAMNSRPRKSGRSQSIISSLPPALSPALLFFPPRSLARTTPRRSKSCADVGTKVAPSALTAALGVVKAKRLLEVSGHQGVMHGSQPGDGSSSVVKVRAAGRPGRCAQADMSCVSVCLCVCVGVCSHEANAVCVLSNGRRVFRQIRQSVFFMQLNTNTDIFT